MSKLKLCFFSDAVCKWILFSDTFSCFNAFTFFLFFFYLGMIRSTVG